MLWSIYKHTCLKSRVRDINWPHKVWGYVISWDNGKSVGASEDPILWIFRSKNPSPSFSLPQSFRHGSLFTSQMLHGQLVRDINKLMHILVLTSSTFSEREYFLFIYLISVLFNLWTEWISKKINRLHDHYQMGGWVTTCIYLYMYAYIHNIYIKQISLSSL